MPSPQLRHPYTVATVSGGRCKPAQVVQILAQTGFWLREHVNREMLQSPRRRVSLLSGRESVGTRSSSHDECC
jgi:hypothetical protein